ncbi:hypothetical protein SUDANB108_04100 [Streptomyces sp. enrichment culture]|uniref:hypothetical protein n=1 Tax=Streptomyces sp. enrichment culture TaxID=1795815 RepID=UPI003F560E2E
MKPRTLPALAALSVTTALLLTACGGSGKSSDNENVAGAEQSAESPKDSPRPSASEAEDRPDGVDLTLPEDMDLVFDWRNPKDANEAAALDDAANSMRAIYRGVHKRTVNDAAVTTYFTGNGLHYAKTQISIRIDAGWTATGTRRHYRAATRSAPNGTSVEVAFCVDSSKFYGKEAKTGQVRKTRPSISDFDHFKMVMIKSPAGEGLWQASKIFVEGKAKQCR